MQAARSGLLRRLCGGPSNWYAQVPGADGARSQVYLGPDADESVRAPVNWVQSAEVRDGYVRRREMVKALRAAGFGAPTRPASGALAVLARAGLLHATNAQGDRTVLVGTPAYMAIMNRLGFGERPL